MQSLGAMLDGNNFAAAGIVTVLTLPGAPEGSWTRHEPGCDVLELFLGLVVFRCASAKGIAQTATRESTINALRTASALTETLVCLFICGPR
jgi:hypothetical protein